jgi:hypothetical protein
VLPFQTQSGSGWGPTGAGTPQGESTQITDAAGNVYEPITLAAWAPLVDAGTTIYFEPVPGLFIPAPANNTGLLGGTPLYTMVPSGTGTNPAATTSTGVNGAGTTTAPAATLQQAA